MITWNMIPAPLHITSLGPRAVTAARALSLAGGLIREAYSDTLLDITEKGVGDLQTSVDTAADALINGVLESAFPQDVVISEELHPDSARVAPGLWLVDPLDGTSGFAFRVSPTVPSTMLAYLNDGELELAFILFPLTGEWFYAKRGHGAFCNAERLSVEGRTAELGEAWVHLNRYGEMRYETDCFQAIDRGLRSERGARLVTSEVPHSGITCRMLHGRQKLHAVVHDNNPEKLKQAAWDLAPQVLIAEEAGACALTSHGGHVNPLEPELTVIANSEALAQAILELRCEGRT